MARSRNRALKPAMASTNSTHPSAAGSRKEDRLKDEVYRQMYLLESHRPGSEIQLAIALLRAVVHAESTPGCQEISAWLKTICPIGLRMLEASPNNRSQCSPEHS